MARIDDLIDEIEDDNLRREIRSTIAELRHSKKFGLVFEEHIPETIALPGLSIGIGSLVQRRGDINKGRRYRVKEIFDNKALLEPSNGSAKTRRTELANLRVVQRFGDTIHPGLITMGSARRGPLSRPSHVVINAENYHAIQLLGYLYEGQVDLLYLDPPYNTGARDWKYNNSFVDNSDSYRHSKWLSMMEKRLRTARRLLKPDGILVITIDEHEVHHLGVLLEQMFPEAYQQMVTIVNNPKGVTQPRFSRVEEYAHFVFFGGASVQSRPDDLLTWGGEVVGKVGEVPRWKGLLRSGTNALPSDRPNMVYAIAIDPQKGRICGAGETLKELELRNGITVDEFDSWPPDRGLTIDGYPVAWPIRKGGELGNWGLGRETLLELAGKGMVRVGNFDTKRRTWALSYLSAKLRAQVESGLLKIVGRDKASGALDVCYINVRDRRIKTVWHRSTHDAGTGGADLLAAHLGARLFDFPKPVYAVRDVIDAVISDRPHALIVDFFAGSGTTLHATLLLNSQDGGCRRCVLVTNNEVEEKVAERLVREGYLPGDAEYECHGIFEAVTVPRCKAAITGTRLDRHKVQGKFIDGRLFAQGFEENVEFLRLDYLNPDEVDLGRQYAAIAPLLWLKAGSVGSWDLEPDGPWSMPEGSTYAVLFDDARFLDFLAALQERPEITHAFYVTDSPASYAEIRAHTPRQFKTSMLYQDYLRNFEISVEGRP